MILRRGAWVAALSLAFFAWISARAADHSALPPPAKIHADYARDIEPIFRGHCYGCHGPQMQMNGLRLDRKADALRGSDSGPVIVPGHSAASKLIRFVAGVDSKVVMPPVGKRLTAAEISLLRAWIDQGANWPDSPVTSNPAPSSRGGGFWAFQKPVRPEVPDVRNRAWVRNPVDNFILAKLESAGTHPSPEADKSTLIRRVSMDLVGLPPTPQEVDEFLQDNRPDAYERLVDRLMASPHFGEKWGRHWLDLARYADSDGYEKDLSRPWAWRYRQWVIDAINHNMPYDEFTIKQIAGDLLPNATIDDRIATGFNRNTLTNREGGVDPEQFRDAAILDRTSTLGQVWLGLTVGCAQCHDHKFDPIKQKEFYQLFAFFNTAEEENIDAPLPGELGPYLLARPEYEKKLNALYAEYKVPQLQAEWEKDILFAAANPGKHPNWDFSYGVIRIMLDNGEKILRMGPSRRTPKQREAMTRYFIANCQGVFGKQRFEQIKFEELKKSLKELDETLPPLSQAPVIAQNPDPPKTYVHLRGDYRSHGDEVQPGTPSCLPPLPAGEKPTRLTLANWLVSKDNPLTARVEVNRMWQELFGRGLVRTSEDFGHQGELPSHPKLLDWLATEFMQHGWDMKYMEKLMVMSAAYRQSSKIRPELESNDPDNALVARQSRFRLPAELIRDEALSASGLINLKVGGPSVYPPQPPGVSELSYGKSGKWPESKGPDRYRRGLYIFFKRTTPYPQLVNFDAPNGVLACSRRQRSDTPLQALNLLNDEVFYEAARGLAYRLVRNTPGDFRDRLNYAYELTLGRQPKPPEAARIEKYFEQEVGALNRNPKSAAELFPNRFHGVDPVKAAAWVEVSRVLLNLDEFMTRE